MAQYIKKLQSGGKFKANGKEYDYYEVQNAVQKELQNEHDVNKNLLTNISYLLSSGSLNNQNNSASYIISRAISGLTPINEKDNSLQDNTENVKSDQIQSKKTERFSNSNSLGKYIRNYLLGNDDNAMQLYLDNEVIDDEKGYSNTYRRQELSKAIDSYLSDVLTKQYDFSQTRYKTQDNYIKAIKELQGKLNDNNFDLSKFGVYAIQNGFNGVTDFLNTYEKEIKARKVSQDPITQMIAGGYDQSYINNYRWENKLKEYNNGAIEMQSLGLGDVQRDENGKIPIPETIDDGASDSAVLQIVKNNGDFNNIINNPAIHQSIFLTIDQLLQNDKENEKKNPLEKQPPMFKKLNDTDNNYLIIPSINLDNGTAVVYNPVELKLFRVHISKNAILQNYFKDEWLKKNPLLMKKGGIFKAQIGIDSTTIANARQKALGILKQKNDTIGNDPDTTGTGTTVNNNDWISRVAKSKKTMSKSDYARFASAVTTLIAAIDPNPVRSLVEGTLATSTDFIVDAFDKDVSSEEAWQRLASNLGLTAASMIPGYMAARWSKLGKEISTVKRYLPYIIGGSMSGGFAVYGGKQISDALNKVLEGKAEKEDWRNLIYGLSSLIGGSRGVKHNISSGSSKVFGNKKEFAITNNGLQPVTHKQYQDLGTRGNDWKTVIGTEDNMAFQIPDNSNNFFGKTANWISDRIGISRYPRTSKYQPSLENLYTYDEGKGKVIFTGDKRIAQGLYMDDRKSLEQLGKNIYNKQVHEKVGNLINKFKQTGNITFDEYKYLKGIYDSNHGYEANLLDILTTLNGSELDPSKVNNIFIQHNGNDSKISRIYTKNQTGEIVIDPQSTEGLTPLDLTYNMNRQKFREYIDSKKPKYSFFNEDQPNIRYDDIEGYNLDNDLVEPARENIVQIGQETGTQAPGPVETDMPIVDVERKLYFPEEFLFKTNNGDVKLYVYKKQTDGGFKYVFFEKPQVGDDKLIPVERGSVEYKNIFRKAKKHNKNIIGVDETYVPVEKKGGTIDRFTKFSQLLALKKGGILKAQSGIQIPQWYKNRYVLYNNNNDIIAGQEWIENWEQNKDRNQRSIETLGVHDDHEHNRYGDLTGAWNMNQKYTSDIDAVRSDIQNYYNNSFKGKSIEDFVKGYNLSANKIRSLFGYDENNKLTNTTHHKAEEENEAYEQHNILHQRMFASRNASKEGEKEHNLRYDPKQQRKYGSNTHRRRMDQYEFEYNELINDEDKKKRIFKVDLGDKKFGYVYKKANGDIDIVSDDELQRLNIIPKETQQPQDVQQQQEAQTPSSSDTKQDEEKPKVEGSTEQKPEDSENMPSGGYVVGTISDILNRNKNKFQNWFKFVPKAAEMALLWSSNASNNKRANIAKQKKPGIVNPLTIFRNTYRDLYGENAAQSQANDMMSSVNQRQTSDASLNIASRLDTNRIVNEAVRNAKNASNQVFNQTAEFQRQADLQTLQSHLDAQNRNSAALTENNNYKIDVEAARLAANQENIKNILTGTIYEWKAKRDELEALRRNLGERVVEYRMQQDLANDPEYQKALEDYQDAYIKDSENSTEETTRRLRTTEKILQNIINKQKAKALQNKIDRLGRLYSDNYFGKNYSLSDDLLSLKKGGRMYGSKIDDSDVKKRTKDHDRLARQVIASLREFNKATDRLSKGQFLSIKKMLS